MRRDAQEAELVAIQSFSNISQLRITRELRASVVVLKLKKSGNR